MRMSSLGGIVAAAAVAAACHPKPLGAAFSQGSDGRPMRTLARLTCPDRVERLDRTAEAADGRSCTYAGPQSERVDLALTPLDGAGADVRLAALDAQLRSEVPGAAAAPGVAQGVYVSGGKGSDQAHIDLPGFHLNATGGKASIRMPGVVIDADNDKAHVSTGFARGAVVNAHEGGAEVRTGGAGPQGVAATYLLATDAPGPSGDRAAGYVAKGPPAGPLVVATFHVPGRREQHGDNSMAGLNRLVDLNVHGG